MKTYYRYIFSSLCIAFLLYSFSIYIQPQFQKPDVNFNIQEASTGRLLWQKNNCQTCHQLYGLGGYLGPDLTNIYSKNNSENIIRAILKAGTGQMPAIQLSETETNQLIEFLKSTNASGTSDPKSFIVNNSGMIEKK